MLKEDLSAVKARIDDLRRQGIDDFAAFFQSHPDVAIDIARCARIVDVNPATLKLFGAATKHEFLENIDRVLTIDSSPLLRLTPNMLCLAASEIECSGEFPAMTLQGLPLYLGFAWNVPDGDTATYSCVFYSLFDLTSRKKAEEAHARLTAELRQAEKMEALAVLASGLAHDFNNSMTVIQGSVDMLTVLVRADPAALDMANLIQNAARHATEQVQQLLSYAHRGDRKPIRVDVHDLMQRVCGLLSHSLGKNICVRMDLHASHPCILADPSQMETTLLNLALNARDAMPNGGTIRFATRIAEGASPGARRSLEIMVMDTGAGMDQAVLARLFEPFFTTKPHGKGTGLGLASVNAFVMGLDGTIRVQSQPGKGTTFTLSVPTCDEKPPASDRPG